MMCPERKLSFYWRRDSVLVRNIYVFFKGFPYSMIYVVKFVFMTVLYGLHWRIACQWLLGQWFQVHIIAFRLPGWLSMKYTYRSGISRVGKTF